MSESKRVLRLDGIVRAHRYDPSSQRKQFLGAKMECRDGTKWVLDYNEQSPFHLFANRRVTVSGHPYEPSGQRLSRSADGQKLGHFRVSIMQIVDVTPDDAFVEIGPKQVLVGRFERGTSNTGETKLSFIAEDGSIFMVVNDPAGASAGKRVEVRAHQVQLEPSRVCTAAKYLWIICPLSAADLWKWRQRRVVGSSLT
jgi:hypothetical protein